MRRDPIYRVPRAGRRGNVTPYTCPPDRIPHPVGRDKSGPYDLLAALGEYSDILIIL